jgi:hypothetical protein
MWLDRGSSSKLLKEKQITVNRTMARKSELAMSYPLTTGTTRGTHNREPKTYESATPVYRERTQFLRPHETNQAEHSKSVVRIPLPVDKWLRLGSFSLRIGFELALGSHKVKRQISERSEP